MTVRGVLDLMVAAFTQEEIDAIVDEAHTLGLTAHAHANGGLGLTRALRAGVDTIEHGTQLTDENVEEMARRGTWLVPMFWIVRYHAENAPEARGFAASPATHRDTMKRFYETSVNSFQRALKAGVRIALGSDAGSHDRHTNASMLEMQYMLDAGMSASEVIVSATRRAAECMRLQDEVGTLEAGKYADLVVVRGNPLQDLRLLAQRESIALVIKDGEAVGGTLLARDLGQIAAAAKA
jgi:imidazolonepropionase-like amidohydrolase